MRKPYLSNRRLGRLLSSNSWEIWTCVGDRSGEYDMCVGYGFGFGRTGSLVLLEW